MLGLGFCKPYFCFAHCGAPLAPVMEEKQGSWPLLSASCGHHPYQLPHRTTALPSRVVAASSLQCFQEADLFLQASGDTSTCRPHLLLRGRCSQLWGFNDLRPSLIPSALRVVLIPKGLPLYCLRFPVFALSAFQCYISPLFHYYNENTQGWVSCKEKKFNLAHGFGGPSWRAHI
jgi:hypothetical protein